MEADPAAAYTSELLELTSDLDQAAATDFVLRVFDGGAEHGTHKALANVASEMTTKDEQIHRLAKRLESLGEDPLAIAKVIRGH